MKVLIFGATGFIGLPIAQAFVRAGHIVYGQTRSDSKRQLLVSEEIIPVVGDTANPTGWISLAASVDVVIDAVGGAEVGVIAERLFQAVLAAVKEKRSALAGKLTYIGSSGTWVYGDDRVNWKTDLSPADSPAGLVAWRPALEQTVIKNETVNGIVIRPSLLIGRGGSILSTLFTNVAKSGEVKWFGTPGGFYSTIHVDDLANLYLLTAEKASLVAGQIIIGANDRMESVDAFLATLVNVSGSKAPYQYIESTNAFEAAIPTTTLLRPYLARTVLGWRATKPSLIDGLPTYYASCLASN